MTPTLSRDDTTHLRAGKAVLRGDAALWFAARAPLAHSPDVSGADFGLPVAVSGVAIDGVVAGRSGVQVRRVHARWVVAGVTDQHPGGNGAMEHLIGHAMRVDDGPFVGRVTVALGVPRERPFPASRTYDRDAFANFSGAPNDPVTHWHNVSTLSFR